MRGEIIGLHTIRYVVTYRSQEEIRYCRLQSNVEIKPSLKMNTRIDYSLKEIDESVLQIVAKPALEARLTIKQISSLSGHSLRVIKELASEVYYLGVRSGQYNQILFDQDWIEPVNIREGFCWDVKNMLKKGKNSNSLDLIVSWELENNNNEVISGHHYLLDLTIIRDTRRNPISVVLLACTSKEHNFTIETLCQVPVKVCFKNISENTLASVYLQAVQDDESGQGFMWVGTTSKRVLDMKPGDISELNLLASFQNPGCYNLNKFSLKVDEIQKEIPKHLHQILIS